MIVKRVVRLFIVLLAVGVVACSGSGDGTETPTRSFSMGFTPWPYDATLPAVDETYRLIQDNGDIVSHHLMSGIPWQDAYDGTAFPAAVEEELVSKETSTEAGKAIFLSIDCLNEERNDLVGDWTDAGTVARQTPWDVRGFDAPEVADAYIKFALRMIDRFQPDYFNYAPEISELIINDRVKFLDFVTFAQRVYEGIKAVHPDLPLMVSVALKSPGAVEADNIELDFWRLSDFIDMVGISVYPYAFFDHLDRGDPANLPVDWIDQISVLAGNKPVAITETGWIAQDLTIESYLYAEQSDAEKQRAYVSELLTSAEELRAAFVIWFAIVDYDALWEGHLGSNDRSKIWKDTGLLDEYLNPRPALDAWQQYYARTRR